MMSLGLETSGRAAEIALLDGEEVVEELLLPASGRRPAQAMFPAIRLLLKKHRLLPADISRVSVSLGPGSFTGLRIGVSFAKTFCWATNAEVAGVATFEAIAENAPGHVNETYVIRDAQRRGLFVGSYTRAERGWCSASPIVIEPRSEWFSARDAADVVTGDGLALLDPESACSAICLDESLWCPRAAVIARLGLSQAASDPFALLPTYHRRSAAEEKAEGSSPRA